MPNTRIRDKWEPLVKQIIADLGPRAGPAPILRELKERVEALRKSGMQVSTDYPSLRTIQRIKDDLTPEEMREYQRFHWPQSIQACLLPWEASAAVLELLAIRSHGDEDAKSLNAFLLSQGGKSFTMLPIMGRPSIRLARWYWYVTQAAPDLPGDWTAHAFQDVRPGNPENMKALEALKQSEENQMPSRYDIARTLATWEAAGTSLPQSLRDAIEAYLAYAPWRNSYNALTYNIAVDEGHIPRLTLEDLHSLDFPLKPNRLEAMREMVGDATAERWESAIKGWHSLTKEEQEALRDYYKHKSLKDYYKREIQWLKDELQKAGEKEVEKEDTNGEAPEQS